MLGIGIGIGKGRAVVGAPAPAGGGVNAVHFDGTNDNLLRGAGLTGAVDGENLLLSFWFNFTGNDAVTNYLFSNALGRVLLTRGADDLIFFRVRTSSPTTIWDWKSVAKFSTTINAGWNHLLIAAQLDVTPVGQVYVGDSALSITEATAPTNGSIDLTDTNYSIGSTVSQTARLNADLAEFYMTNEYLDIGIEANRRKFIDAAGKPADLGEGGITPTGTLPLVFLSGDTDAWHTNKGSGGGFTETGALTDAATSPSD